MSVQPIHKNSPEPDVRIERITPERAREYLGFNTHNRNLRQRVVRAYAADMLSGDWEWNGEAIKFAADGTLLDGQHRLAAIIESGVAVRMLVIRSLPNRTQDTMDTGAKRKFSDVLKLRGEENAITLSATVRGITSWENGYRVAAASARAYTNRELLRTLEAYPWIRNGMPSIERAKRNAGLPSAVGGVLWWAFMQIDAEDAQHFFDRLASDEGHRAGEPIHTLRRLLALTQEGTRGERNGRYLMAVAIKAWNKYRDGEDIHQLKFRVGGANPEKFPEPR